MKNFEVGDKVRICEEKITGMWIETFKERHPRKDGIHEVSAKMGRDLYLLDGDQEVRDFPFWFAGSWLRKAERSPKFKVGDMVRVLDGKDIEKYTDGWCMEGRIGHIFEIEAVKDFKDGRFGYKPKRDILTYDERGLELVEGVRKDPTRAYITDEKLTSAERETIPKAKIQKLLGDIGQMIVAYRKDDEGEKADGMEIVAFALRMALK